MHTAILRRLAVVVVLLSLTLTAVSPVAAVATPCADLRIIAMSIDPTVPVQNQTATVHITIQNVGTCAAQAFVVQWQSDQFTLPGPSVSIDNLNANASVVVDLQYAFPNAGNFMTIVNVDTGNAVNETNEVNNLEILPVSIAQATVDLVITDVKVETTVANPLNDPIPVAGRVARATITIANNGNSASGPFQVQWTPWLFETPLTTQVNGLGAGATTTVTFDYTYWWAATFDGWATVDSGGWVFETNANGDAEFNNTFNKSVVVEPALPDLIVTNFTINPAAPVPGQIATATVTVQNKGHANAGPFRVQWQPWWLSTPVSVQVNSLGEGLSTNVTFNYVYWFPGKFDGTVTVDSTNWVFEIREDNNTKPVTVTVGPNHIDLTITDLTIVPASPTQGEPATINLGNTPAGNFMVEVNPDSLFLFTPGPQTISKQVTGLAAGATTTVSFPYTYPVHGNVRILANVDAFNNIAESNQFGPAEHNNLKILNVTVQPAPIDLIITSFTITPASPVRGIEATATITVKNNGPWPANDFAVQWLLNEDDAFGPLEFVNGLNPGESRTVTLKGTYFVAGTFTSKAIVDVFDMVLEPGAGELNNEQTKTVTVVPQQSTVRVTLNSVNVSHAGEDGIDGNAEWDPMVFAVLDSDANCSFAGQSIPGVECQVFSDGAVNDGDTLNLNRSIDVTLVEFTPLVFAFGAYEDDEVIGIPLPGEIMGFAFNITFPPDYLTLGSISIPGEGGESGCGSDGQCFTANFTVTVLSTNMTTAMAAAATNTLPLETQIVLDNFRSVAQLPPLQ